MNKFSETLQYFRGFSNILKIISTKIHKSKNLLGIFRRFKLEMKANVTL